MATGLVEVELRGGTRSRRNNGSTLPRRLQPSSFAKRAALG